jgi:hypothetical protein
MLVAGKYFTAESFISLAEENEITGKIQSELQSYFKDKYNETGIPPETYTDVITDDYVDSLVKININAGFSELNGGSFDNTTGIENSALEQSIEDFFSSYADSIDYEKDDTYQEKLNTTIDNAYSAITEYCDIYKLGTLSREGILSKAAKVYTRMKLMTYILVGAAVLIILLLILINKSGALYWVGISAVISGIIGVLPCIYIKFTRYFDAFVIKQQQVFTSFTTLMYKSVNSFMMNQIILAAAGVVMIIAFALLRKKSR